MSRPADSRAILEQMGVNVWVTRRLSDSAEVPAPASVEVAQQAQAPAAEIQQPAAEIQQPAAEIQQPAAEIQQPVADIEQPAAATKKAPALKQPQVAPFTVHCLQKGDALLLYEPADVRASRRFASDILSAASGVWGGQAAALAFEWPQPGIESDVETQKKALGAFVAKQISDQIDASAASIVLIASEVLDRLAKPPPDCVVLPPLATLMVQADLKRALWADIGSRAR